MRSTIRLTAGGRDRTRAGPTDRGRLPRKIADSFGLQARHFGRAGHVDASRDTANRRQVRPTAGECPEELST
eukprot:4056155-Karenia_brevis.AAC.1